MNDLQKVNEMINKRFLRTIIILFVFFSLVEKLLFLYVFSRIIIKSNEDISDNQVRQNTAYIVSNSDYFFVRFFFFF